MVIEARDRQPPLMERVHGAVRVLRRAGVSVSVHDEAAWNQWTPATLFSVGPYRKIGAYEMIRLAALDNPAVAVIAADRRQRCEKCGFLLRYNHACPLPACRETIKGNNTKDALRQ